MFQVPSEVALEFERRREGAGVPASGRLAYRKWLRFYVDFCRKYSHPPRGEASLGPFLGKLASKNQSAGQRQVAAAADANTRCDRAKTASVASWVIADYGDFPRSALLRHPAVPVSETTARARGTVLSRTCSRLQDRSRTGILPAGTQNSDFFKLALFIT